MTMLRLLPMGLFGFFLGALAERFDRGRTLLVLVLLMGGTSAVLALLGRTGQLEIWQLALASFIGWCTDLRCVMIGEVVGRERMAPRCRWTSAPAMQAAWSALQPADSCSQGRAFKVLLF
jgi:hypothetical protein